MIRLAQRAVSLGALLLMAAPATATEVAANAGGAAVLECPMRDAPFSARSPFLDLLLNLQARAIAEEALGPDIEKLPSIFLRTETPSFAAIITLETAAKWAGLPPERVSAADHKLRLISVSDQDRKARCARYDNDRPALKLDSDRPQILLFEKINGYRDTPSVDAAHKAFETIAKQQGWQITTTDKGGAITPEILGQFDAVIWNNVSGDVLTLPQQAALKNYVEDGGGFVAVHGSAGDPVYFWDWFPDTLIGARFQGHPREPQFQAARIVTEDGAHPVAAGLPREWRLTDEWYSFRTNPRDSGSQIVMTLDETSYDPDAGLEESQRMGDHPVVWTRRVGDGRVFYSAIGHRPELYSDPHYVQLLSNAVKWSAGLGGEASSQPVGD